MTTPRRPRRKASPRLTLNRKDLAALSHLVGRFRFLQKAGLQYGTKRDVYAVAGYPLPAELRFEHYYGLYRRNGIARRIVNMPVNTTWRVPPEIAEEDRPDGTKFTDAFNALATRLKLWRYLQRTDRLAGIGQYGVLFIGVRGVSEDAQLAQPLERVARAEDVIFLQPYHEGDAEIDTLEANPGDARYQQPKLYRLRREARGAVGAAATRNLVVHHTRVLHVAEDLDEDEVYGHPRLEAVLNRLFDLDKVAASTGEAYWQHVVRILQAKVDPEADIDSDTEKDLRDQMAEIMHDLRRQFIGQGAELQWLGTDTPNASQVFEMYAALIAAEAGIPQRILFGSERGELASTTDQENWLGQISERQIQYVEPMILRAFIDRMIALKALPEPETGEYQVVWPTLFEEPEKEIADANLKRAQAAATLAGPGGDALALVEIDEERNVFLIPREPGTPGIVGDLPPPADDDEPEDEDHLEADADEEELLNNLSANQAQTTEIQTLIFPKRHWPTAARARRWAQTHDFTAGAVEETSGSFRIRQRAPDEFQDGSFRTICLVGAEAPGDEACRVQAVIGRPRA